MSAHLNVALLAGLLLACDLQAAPLSNQLAGSASPYLASHATDPVNWQPWGRAALEHAQSDNRLILLSSGYFTCYFCHRLQRESFQDEAFADYVNGSFVPVLIDRELETAMDGFLTRFMQASRRQAGWPMLVLLTPAGYPLAGTLYLGRDELLVFLQRIDDRWSDDADTLSRIAVTASAELSRQQTGTRVALAKEERPYYARGFLQQALLVADDEQGGFGDSEKYPHAPQLRAMVRAHYRAPSPLLETFLRRTLDHMAAGGLRDHVHGGFFRYATDPDWQFPHFEKMLSLNALLAEVYLEASLVMEEPRYREIAFDTLRFALHAFRVESGGYCSGLSAYSANGARGGYYLWQADELSGLLAMAEFARVQEAWKIGHSPPFPGGYLPSPFPQAASTFATLRRRAATRALPRDDKVIAADNGLLLRVLSQAARLDAGFTMPAKELRDYLLRRHWDGDLLLRLAVGQATQAGELSDYAYVADGLLAYASLSGQSDDRGLVIAVATQAWERFFRDGAWRLSETSLPPVPASLVAVRDGAEPSPSAVLMTTSLALPRVERTPAMENGLRDVLRSGAETMRSEPFFHATQITALWLSDE